MILASIALLAAQATEAPWDDYEGEVTGYQFEGASDAVFTIQLADVTRVSGGVSAWMQGDHTKDKSVPYRTSMEKLFFNCAGSVSISAKSQYSSDGKSTYSWDGYGRPIAIRPDTIYASFEDALCKDQ